MEAADTVLYVGTFLILLLLAAVMAVAVERTTKNARVQDPEFRAFKFWFLLGWGICVAADWLQGPYLYVLYSGYGFKRDEIGGLFLAGFVVSGLAGSFVGILADRFGRRLACEVYCLLYICACVTKHFNHYGILMIGRVAGGFATSLLFSVFESWVVSELLLTHKVDTDALRHLLGRMYLTSYSAAIVTGLLSQGLVALVSLHAVPGAGGFHWGGSTLPYDASILGLFVGLLIMHFRWKENFGARSVSSGAPLPRDCTVWLLGLVCACFESSMYIFVFNLTPALPGQPMGLVFSLFMIASMSGAFAVALLGRANVQTADCLPAMMLIAAGALAVPPATGFSFYPTIFALILFEAVAGFYWPAMATVKGQVVPEQCRANVYNLYRVPLNAIVVGVLIKGPSLQTSFIVTSVLLVVAFCLSIFVAVALRRSRSVEAREQVVCEVGAEAGLIAT